MLLLLLKSDPNYIKLWTTWKLEHLLPENYQGILETRQLTEEAEEFPGICLKNTEFVWIMRLFISVHLGISYFKSDKELLH
jgi:hypothetical protein